MNRSNRSDFRPSSRRRGVTLVEMLVTVAVLIIIMTILVQVFQAATGAVSASQAIAQLDDQLRRLDGTIRADLAGVTATFTPPLDPALNKGYFEYGENEFADAQGEDSDDYIRFTAKAPPGQPFTGRMWINPTSAFPQTSNAIQPVTVTSEYAEIIYFLRNGNLYRRVLLVAPELQSAITPGLSYTSTTGPVNNVPYPSGGTLTSFSSASLGGTANPVSWQGLNDLSARPATTGPNTNSVTVPSAAQAQQTIVLNTLGDLTNREKRAFVPRFANDFVNANPGGLPKLGPDGLFDDLNQDNLPDMYPSLYPGILNPGPYNPNVTTGWQLVFAPPLVNPNGNTGNQTIMGNPGFGLLAFPYIFPGMYSRAQTVSSDAYGWIHSPNPKVYVNTTTHYQYDLDPIDYLQNINHNPLDLGDNLPLPANQAGYTQTWWGFPTWRETLSPFWNDPTWSINIPNALGQHSQPNLLIPLTSAEVSGGVVGSGRVLLPPMTSAWRYNAQLFTDSLGDTTKLFPSTSTLWTGSWEDDLIMTGVRSFDIKAYDNAYAGYVDLGWGDDLRLYTPYKNLGGYINPKNVAPGLSSTPTATFWPPLTTGTLFNTVTQTFAHEGRIPPLVEDNRLDAQFPNPTYGLPNYAPQYPAVNSNYSSNIGDDNKGVVRLRRVWDSWSTDYSHAPPLAVDNTTGFPSGPPFAPPPYPSYPPPYPAPLRGIQIQIRVVDPTNQRVKSLTIVQNFTDKL